MTKVIFISLNQIIHLIVPWTERRLWQVQRSQGLQDIRMVPRTRNYWSSTWYWENVLPYRIHLWPREEQCSNFQRTGLSRLWHCWYGKTWLHIEPRKPFSYMHISLTGARSWTWFHSAFGSEILMQPCADCVLYIFLRVLLAFEFRSQLLCFGFRFFYVCLVMCNFCMCNL